MAQQITLTLPEDLLTFLDARIKAGEAPSRSGLIINLLKRERRRDRARQDAAILAHLGTDPELDRLAQFGSTAVDDTH